MRKAISCEAAIRLWASSEADCEYSLDRKRNSGGSSWMAASIASPGRVSMTGSITWNSKKQDVDQADFICNRHPKILSGFEIWYRKNVTVQYIHSYESKFIKNCLRRWDFDLYVSGFWHIHAKAPRVIVDCWIVTEK